MVRRRDTSLLGSTGRNGSGTSPAAAAFLGLICGVSLGALLTFTLFSGFPRTPERDLKGERSEESVHHDFSSGHDHQISEPDVSHLIHRNDVDAAEKYITVKSVDGVNTSNEGTREISDFERHGGWRFLPEVLEVAKRHPKAQVLSHDSPVLILLKGFLSRNETEHMVELASTHMDRSKVVSDTEKDHNKGVSNTRTSYGAWLSHQWRDDVVASIEMRIHDTVGIPREFGEGIYVLRYQKDQKYDPHTDNCAKKGELPRSACVKFLSRAKGAACGDGFGGASCGDRIATFILYLRTPTKGGETVFPESDLSRGNLEAHGRGHMHWNAAPQGWYCNDDAVFKVSPEAGDAVLFWDYKPRSDITDHKMYIRSGNHEKNSFDTEAVNDPTALHGGCPVAEGEKWIATRWIRSSQFI